MYEHITTSTSLLCLVAMPTLILMKFNPNCLHRALANKVLPVPGAPNSRTPGLRFSVKLEYTFGNYKNTLAWSHWLFSQYKYKVSCRDIQQYSGLCLFNPKWSTGWPFGKFTWLFLPFKMCKLVKLRVFQVMTFLEHITDWWCSAHNEMSSFVIIDKWGSVITGCHSYMPWYFVVIIFCCYSENILFVVTV